MDILTLTVLAAQQPLRAVQDHPSNNHHWCASCILRAHNRLGTAPGEMTHLPFADFRVSTRCVDCESPLDYRELEHGQT